jgi:3-isopropylmalate dehydrogenase
MAADAVLLEPLDIFDNDPKATVRPEQGLLLMRKKLGLFKYVRPTFTFLQDRQFTIERERPEGTDLLFHENLPLVLRKRRRWWRNST